MIALYGNFLKEYKHSIWYNALNYIDTISYHYLSTLASIIIFNNNHYAHFTSLLCHVVFPSLRGQSSMTHTTHTHRGGVGWTRNWNFVLLHVCIYHHFFKSTLTENPSQQEEEHITHDQWSHNTSKQDSEWIYKLTNYIIQHDCGYINTTIASLLSWYYNHLRSIIVLFQGSADLKQTNLYHITH